MQYPKNMLQPPQFMTANALFQPGSDETESGNRVSTACKVIHHPMQVQSKHRGSALTCKQLLEAYLLARVQTEQILFGMAHRDSCSQKAHRSTTLCSPESNRAKALWSGTKRTYLR